MSNQKQSGKPAARKKSPITSWDALKKLVFEPQQRTFIVRDRPFKVTLRPLNAAQMEEADAIVNSIEPPQQTDPSGKPIPYQFNTDDPAFLKEFRKAEQSSNRKSPRTAKPSSRPTPGSPPRCPPG